MEKGSEEMKALLKINTHNDSDDIVPITAARTMKEPGKVYRNRA